MEERRLPSGPSSPAEMSPASRCLVHRVRERPMPIAKRRREFATQVVSSLREAGFAALWAGGCVRDLLLGLTPNDYDVATSATPEQVMRLFRNRTIPVGASFGVVRVRSPHDGDEVEVATFRSDGAYL